MVEANIGKHDKAKFIVSLIACIFVGITFVVSGTGKLFEFGVVPGQTLDFLGFVLPEAWLNQGTLTFLEILITYIVPCVELAIGLFLLIGFIPRLIAIFIIPLSLIFMANNIFSIFIGMDVYPQCTCFGIWGKIFGTMTPLQSLCYDIVLLIMALIIIIVIPLPFMSSQKWLQNLIAKRNRTKTEV
jgi:uncharacterized membrane protein YphA (DoxX/SURF4 family)